MAVTLGSPGPGDVTALAALKTETFLATYAADNDPDELAAHVARTFGVATVAKQLADPRCLTYWLMDGGKPVAYAKLNTGGAQTVLGLTDGLEVEQLYVLASHAGRGLGGMLLGARHEDGARAGPGLPVVGRLGAQPQGHRLLRAHRIRGLRRP